MAARVLYDVQHRLTQRIYRELFGALSLNVRQGIDFHKKAFKFLQTWFMMNLKYLPTEAMQFR